MARRTPVLNSHQGPKVPKIEYHTFNGLRGIAAILVMIFHCSFRAHWDQPIKCGYLAVDLFFALSGFVVAQAYSGKLLGDMSLASFAIVRLLRLYPLYAMGTSIGILYFLLFAANAMPVLPILGATAAAIFFLPVPVHLPNVPPIFPLDGPAWSLFFELFINFAYALFLPLLTRKRCILIIAIAAAMLLCVGFVFHNAHVGWAPQNLVGGFPRVIFSFGVGIAIFNCRPSVRVSTPHAIAIVVMAALLITFGRPQWFYDIPVILMVFPPIVYAASMFQPSGATSKFFDFLGYLSYAIYIVHVPLQYIAASVIDRLDLSAIARFLAWLATMTLIFLISWLLTKFFDDPIRNYSRRGRSIFAVD
jgi:peptidoglycan/LPS O-acetylase OafA/YrhL